MSKADVSIMYVYMRACVRACVYVCMYVGVCVGGWMDRLIFFTFLILELLTVFRGSEKKHC